MESIVGSLNSLSEAIGFRRISGSSMRKHTPATKPRKHYRAGGTIGYRTWLMILLAATTVATSNPTLAGHEEGTETNVAMVACRIDREAPNRIDVIASSVNMTQNHIPNISRQNSCAENLHKLLTTGFKIEEASLENAIFVFVLTREDKSSHKH